MIRSGRMADSAEMPVLQSDEPLEAAAWQWPSGDVCFFSQPLASQMAAQPVDADWGSTHDGSWGLSA
jgi:hypothetical protein